MLQARGAEKQRELREWQLRRSQAARLVSSLEEEGLRSHVSGQASGSVTGIAVRCEPRKKRAAAKNYFSLRGSEPEHA